MAQLTRLTVLVLAASLLAGCGGDDAPGTVNGTPAAADELRIGALVPKTGIAASVGPEIEAGIEFVLAEAGYEVGGHPIVLIIEDESDNPANAVTRAHKLVEEDDVDVVIGPILAHTSAAVAPYLERQGIPHLPWGMADSPQSAHSIYTAGTGTGLDVFANEPHVPEALLEVDNVVLQPHVGSATRETRQAMGRLVLENLLACLRGDPLPTPVNRPEK